MTKEQITEMAKEMAEGYINGENPDDVAVRLFPIFGPDAINHREEIDRQATAFIEANRIDQLAYAAAVCFEAGVPPEEYNEIQDLFFPGLKSSKEDLPAIWLRGVEIRAEMRLA